jgi:hypothetical protein
MLQILARRFRSLQLHFSKLQHLQHPSFTAVRPVIAPLLAWHPHSAQLSTQPRSQPPTGHPEGIEPIDIKHVEESLGATTEQGHGYLWIEFGDTIGPHGRYIIIRKLGWGMNASVWMAFDKKYIFSFFLKVIDKWVFFY